MSVRHFEASLAGLRVANDELAAAIATGHTIPIGRKGDGIDRCGSRKNARAQLGEMLQSAPLPVTQVALAWGGLLGLLIGLILVKRVNPQSFHWTMDLAVPLHILVPAGLALLATAAVTAVVAGRSASAGGPLLAVRQDW